MKVINLFGGPGTGKSTVGAGLFALMKWNSMNVELVTEYAKDLTWEKRHDLLMTDQLYILAKQNRRLMRLDNQVEYVVTDSPLVMGLAYSKKYYSTFAPFVKDLWSSYDNLNIFLNRLKPYHTVGRKETEEEAKWLDNQIKHILDSSGQEYYTVDADENAKHKILDIVSNHVG